MVKPDQPPAQQRDAFQEGMEQLLAGLPAWLREILQGRAREILSGIVIAVLGVALWAGYSAYIAKQENQASAALATALQQKDTDRKIDALRQVIQRHGDTMAGDQAVLLLSAIYRDAGRLEEAKASFSKARKEYEDGVLGAGSTLGLGYVEEESGLLAEAKAQYVRAVDIGHGFEATALLDLARVAEASGQTDEALQAYERFLSEKPQSGRLDYVRYRITRLSRQEGSPAPGQNEPPGASE